MKRLPLLAACLSALIGFASPAAAQVCIPPTAGLVGWWPGDGHAVDLVGTANGTLIGGATFAPGLNGRAFSLDGIDDYVSLPDDPVWDFGSNDFTIGLWVRMDRIRNSMFIQQLAGSSAGGFQLYFYQDSSDSVLAFANNSTHNGILADWFPQPSTWYYLAVTRSAGTYRLWVNGLQLGTDQFDPDPVADVSGPVRVGSYSGGGFEVSGLIEDLEVHHRALAPAEIGNRVLSNGTSVCASGPIISAPLSLFPGRVGRPYSQAIIAAHGAPPYVFLQATGTLPSGVFLESTGLIHGTPTTPGAFDLTARVVDSIGQFGDRAYSLEVFEAEACIAPTAGLVGWWPGDGHAVDLVGNANGTLVGGTTFAAGLSGQAFSLDGIDDYVSLPDDTVWDFGSSDFTIGLWVRMDQIKNSMFVQQLDGSSAGGFQFYFYPGVLAFANNSTHNGILADWFPQPSTWYYLAVTRSAGTYRLWVNGLQLGTDQFDPDPVADVSGPVHVGSYSGGSFEVSGAIEDLEVHHRALSPAEIAGRWLSNGTTVCASYPDTTAPVVSVPGPITATAVTPGGTVVTFTATASDNVDGALPASCQPPSGSTFAPGATTVICTATDFAGNTGSGQFIVTVTVADHTPPVQIVPADQTREATSHDGAVATFAASALDAIDGPVPTLCSPASGTTFALGETHVTCVATDRAGNTSAATFTITVVDTTPPSLTIADLTATATDPAGVPVEFTPTSHDLVSGDGAPVCSPTSGSTFAIGSHGVTCSATDEAGNGASASFTITVLDGVRPVVTVPGNQTLEATSNLGAVATFTSSASDNIDEVITPSCSPESGSAFSLGLSMVTCTATDAAQNTSSASFTITVRDTIPPKMPLHNVVATAATGNTTLVTYTVTALDIVDGSVTPTCEPASGSAFPIGDTPVSCTATDAAGNITAGGFTVMVNDGAAPIVTVPIDFTREATSAAGAVVIFSASALDNVDGSVAVDCAPASGSTLALATTQVSCHATDSAGNTGSAIFRVAVIDTTAPALALPSAISSAASLEAGLAVAFTVSAADLVDGNRPAVCVPASGTTFAPGTTTVSCGTSDSRGNAAIGSFTVTVTLVENRIGRFVAFSTDQTWLRKGTTVLSGDIGANRAMPGSAGRREQDDDGERDHTVEVRIGENVKMQQPGARVVGDTVWLRAHASVYDVLSNELINRRATVLGALSSPVTLPYLTMPAFPTVTAGTQTVTVNDRATLTLAPGRYGNVRVKQRGTLVLTGGLYEILSLDLDQQATVIFRGPTELRIKTELDTDGRSKMILDQSVSGLRASQILIYVAGGDAGCQHDGHGADGDDAGPTVVHIGEQNVIQANVYAPNGSLWLKARTQATGSFIGQRVRIGENVQIAIDSAFR